MITIGSLFSGIGGLELGLERALDAHTVWQVEVDEFCRRVLARNWPHAVRYDDVQTARSLPSVDVICGGFPCQDISNAGKRAGITGERSGLWKEYARIVGETRPRVVVVENVAALAGRGLAVVLRDLTDLGYVGSWHVVSAASVGAPHLRRRIFVIATDRDSVGLRDQSWWGEAWARASVSFDARSSGNAADPASPRLEGRDEPEATRSTFGFFASSGESWCGWTPASAVRRMDDGPPAGVDRPRRRRPRADRLRLKALGNAVVPQVAEVVGRVVAQVIA